MPGTHDPIEVFYSYAHEDEPYLQELEKHLSLLKRQGLISGWYDRQIEAGTDWAKDIATHLNHAEIILLLISSDFLASNFCYGNEMRRALERHQADEARVIPILLRSVDWQSSPFAHLQVLPTDKRFITTWENRDAAFTDVATGIRRAIEDLSLLTINLPQNDFPPIWNVPVARNPFFTGREELLTRLRSQFQAGQISGFSQPQAISGLGGVGKTQLAIEYAYRYRREYQAVFWARADSTENLTSSYLTLAMLLKLSEKEAQEQALIVQAVKTWLQTHEGWLLILDNADEPDLLAPFLPPALGGHLLLTTRATALRGQGVSRPIEIDSFDAEHGALFLLHRAGLLEPDATLVQAKLSDQEYAKQLTYELGGLPLALDQAGAYLEATGSSLQAYQQIYQQYHTKLLNERRGLPQDHPEPVATTWSLSFMKVEEKYPAAAELLRLCAFLAPDAIGEEILTQGAEDLGPVLALVAADAFLLNQAIEALRAYSLLGRDPVTKTLSIHRLLQAVIKDEMTGEWQCQWTERVVRAVNRIFPFHEEVPWSLSQRYLPHALVCQSTIEKWHLIFFEAAQLLNKAGWYLIDRGQYSEAESLFQRAQVIYERVLEPDHPDIVSSINSLAALYTKQNKNEQAEFLWQQALQIRERVLGPEHPDTALSLNNLAALYMKQGKYEKVEMLLKQVRQIREQVLGPEHPQTASSLNDLAFLYNRQGKTEQAELLWQQALQTRERVLGPEHPHTASSLNNMAALYEEQGKYEQAEPLYQRALQIRERMLGPNHPDMASSLNNLAGLYNMQSKYEQAEPLYQRALQIRERVLGPEHPDTALSLNNLAALYKDQSKYEQAEPLYQRALHICERVLGPEHPSTAGSLNNLAALYDDQGKYEQAEPLYQRALHICERVLGPEHPDTALSLNNLAILYKRQGKYEHAEQLLQRVLEMRTRVLGLDHPDTISSLNNLAFTYEDQEKYEQAEPLLQQALTTRQRTLGSDHPDTAFSLYNLALFYKKQDNYEQAEVLYQRTLQIHERAFGEDHARTMIVLKSYVDLLRKMNKL